MAWSQQEGPAERSKGGRKKKREQSVTSMWWYHRSSSPTGKGNTKPSSLSLRQLIKIENGTQILDNSKLIIYILVGRFNGLKLFFNSSGR